jgi:hypothetical protein
VHYRDDEDNALFVKEHVIDPIGETVHQEAVNPVLDQPRRLPDGIGRSSADDFTGAGHDGLAIESFDLSRADLVSTSADDLQLGLLTLRFHIRLQIGDETLREQGFGLIG